MPLVQRSGSASRSLMLLIEKANSPREAFITLPPYTCTREGEEPQLGVDRHPVGRAFESGNTLNVAYSLIRINATVAQKYKMEWSGLALPEWTIPCDAPDQDCHGIRFPLAEINPGHVFEK